MKTDLKGITLKKLQDMAEGQGEPKFRAAQILSWLYNKSVSKRVDSLCDMGNISKACIDKLRPITCITSLKLDEENGDRYVFTAEDGMSLHAELKGVNLFPAVQIGCSYSCRFCRYGRMGLMRGLKTGEIVDQILKVQRRGKEVKRVIIGGMGEPLHCPETVMDAVEIITAQWGLGMRLNNIVLYTCGIVTGIDLLAERRIPIRLVVGLHSADDTVRSGFMSVNKEYPVDTLLESVKRYGHRTGITVQLEYILFRGINDSYTDAKLLIKKLLGLPVRVVLIPYRRKPGSRLHGAGTDRQEEFLQILTSGNIRADIRG